MQSKPKKTVVIGLLGTVLDIGHGENRWQRWRPSVALCQHEDLLVDRFELLCDQKFASLSGQVVADIGVVSPETTVRPHLVSFRDPWDFQDVFAALHDFARGYSFNPENEDYLVHITTGTHVAQICLFLLTESHYLPAQLIQTSPSQSRGDSLPGEYRIIDLDLSKYDRLASRFAQEQLDSTSFLKSGIETRNPRFNALIDQIERVAIHSQEPLLLMGPTGAGKSQLARRIYDLKKSRRQLSGPFIEVNCATLRGDAAMSGMFGHVKGSFTGATNNRPGLLRAADGGVLFLDEIGELGIDEQAMLLRALEEKRFLPVGSDEEASSSFQLIAGTNRILATAVADGRFRDDLLARINLWTFELPSLRERPEDIEPNLRYELEKFAKASGSKAVFNKEALQRFLRFATSSDAKWSGNFRDLNAAMIRMGTMAVGGRITLQIVEDEINRLEHSWTVSVSRENQFDLTTYLTPDEIERIDPFDRVQLAEVIRVCSAARSLSDAGRKLFSASRKVRSTSNDADRIRKYLARFKIDWHRVRTS
jgi:transcriptional regulatory protein RtcR